MNNKRYVQTIGALAAAVDLSERQVSTWKGRPGWPRRTQRGYDVAAVLKFIEAHKLEQAKKTAAGGGILTPLKAERLREEILLLRSKRLELERQLVPVDVVRADMIELGEYVKQSVLGWPRDVAAMHTIDGAFFRDLEQQAGRVIGRIGQMLATQGADGDPEVRAAAERLGILAMQKWTQRNGKVPE